MANLNKEFVLYLEKKSKFKPLIIAGLGMIITPVISICIIFDFLPGKINLNGIPLVFLICFFIFLEFWLIKTFLWLFRGQEKITLNENSLKIEKIGSILDFPTTYKLEKIKTFSIAEKKA